MPDPHSASSVQSRMLAFLKMATSACRTIIETQFDTVRKREYNRINGTAHEGTRCTLRSTRGGRGGSK